MLRKSSLVAFGKLTLGEKFTTQQISFNPNAVVWVKTSDCEYRSSGAQAPTGPVQRMKGNPGVWKRQA